MSIILPYLVNGLQTYGYPALWLSIFIAALGAPLPIGLMMLAAGAFAALGDFNIILLALISITASICGDNAGYWIGRRIGSKVLLWLAQKPRFGIISPQVIARSQSYFQKRGAWAILLSRCLVTALGGSTNIVAGAEVYPYHRFLIFDAIGETIGSMIPLVLGYIFGASLEAVGDMLTTISLLIIALLLLIYCAFTLAKLLRRMKATQKSTEARGMKKNRQVKLKIKQNGWDSLPL